MKQELVIKSNALLQHPLYKTATELKIFSKVVLAIRKNPELDEFTFQVKNLIEDLGCHPDEYYRLKKVAKSMFRVVDLNPSEKLFHLSAVFTDIVIVKEGVITFEVNPKVKPFIWDLGNNYTKYFFRNIACLNSNFSIRIYELLKQYEKIGFRKISLDDLRDFLNIDEHKFERFNDFKRKVILYAKNELKEKTDIYFEFEEIKLGRRISEINFIIKKNKKIVEQITAIELMATQDNIISIEQNQPPINDQVEHLAAMGVTRSTAEEIAAQYPEERIAKAIAYTLDKQQEGGVKTPAAFVVTAIKKDFNDAKAEEKRKKSEVLRQKREQEALKKQWQAIKKQYSDWKTGAVEDILANMTAQELDDYQHQFRQTGIYELMRPNFRKNPESEQRYFKLHIRDQLPMDTLEQWAQKNTVDLSVFSDEIRRD